VDVAAFLPRPLLPQLKIALGSEHTLISVSSWSELQTAVQRHMIDVVVADPCASGAVDVEPLELIRRHYPSLPVVIYTSLGASAFAATVRLAKSGIEHVVLSRFDDEPRRFLELLESIPAHELGDRMLKELAGPLSCLPVVVVRGIDQLFRSPARFTSAGDLAAAAGMNLRTLYRNLEPAGFYSARALVVAARLVRAYAYLRDPGRSIKDVAAKTGYTSPWQLSQHMREMTGRTAEQVRRDMSPDELISRMVEQVQQRRQGE
jgi:AraC-like DNA-binding protein